MAECFRLGNNFGQLFRRNIDHATVRGVGNRLQHQDVAQSVQDIGGESARLLTRFDDSVHDLEQAGGIGGRQGGYHFIERAGIGDTDEFHRICVCDADIAGARDELPEQRQGVAHATFGGSCDQCECCGVGGDSFGFADSGHVRAQDASRYEPECVVMRAGLDGPQDLFRFRGGEHESEMRGGFLDELEQGVPGIFGELVGFIDDVNGVPAVDRGKRRALAQLAGVLHRTMRGGVNFDHVDGAGAVGRQIDAGLTHSAWLRSGAFGAIQAAGKDPGAGGFAAAAGAGKQVRVVHPIVGQCTHERTGDLFLADDIHEPAWTVFAIQRERHATTLTTRDFRPGGITKGPPAHPTEPGYPCCLPALGGLAGRRHAGDRGPVYAHGVTLG